MPSAEGRPERQAAAGSWQLAANGSRGAGERERERSGDEGIGAEAQGRQGAEARVTSDLGPKTSDSCLALDRSPQHWFNASIN